MMKLHLMMAMFVKMWGPLPEAPLPTPVRHARICKCMKAECNAPVKYNTERKVSK